MPPQLLFDISRIDLNAVVYDQAAIRDSNPHRGEMEQLNGIAFADPQKGQIIGFKDVRPDEFWVAGHIPGRPLLPGVLMLESGAQLASFYSRRFEGWEGFIGFSGASDIRFRVPVAPNHRLYILGLRDWVRHGRFSCRIQGLVNGALVFEATILGTRM